MFGGFNFSSQFSEDSSVVSTSLSDWSDLLDHNLANMNVSSLLDKLNLSHNLSQDVNSVSNSLDNLSEFHDLLSDDNLLLVNLGDMKDMSQVSDLSSDDSHLMDQLVDSLGNLSDNSSLDNSQVSSDNMTCDLLVGNNSDGTFDSVNLSHNLSNNLSQDNNLSSDDNLLWFRSFRKFHNQLTDCLSNNSDLVVEFVDSLLEDLDNLFLFFSDDWSVRSSWESHSDD